MGIETIKGLVERFSEHHAEYTSGRYNETALRRDFLDPFFEALGWDVFNRKNFSEAYREVIHEDSIEVDDSQRAPDYCFRLGGRRVFFVEAKKPAVNLKEHIQPAYQVRRYGWSAKLPVSILTDFEEFAVYDCRLRPLPGDKAATARVKYLRFDEYAARWDELTGLFSPGAIQQGALEKWVGSSKMKKGTAAVDDAFLEEIEGWRELLAKSIALRNPDLSVRDLNFAVQRTIDRIIFLRIAEDRGIETYATLQGLLNGADSYKRLVELFRRADERYNSGLFHFRDEKGQGEAPDGLTPRLQVDDKPLKEILRKLYYPECPYEFSVLGADILGSVYERFLGRVIRLTAGHRAVVEEKPEVRKAGGVYYTPTYIVDYIVKNTVGKLLEGKTPKQAAELKVLDPACGSGSFLLGAYQHLLDWHLEQYAKEPDKHSRGKDPELYQDRDGDWRLTTAERKRILLNNIHGVDIDAQAVEVTKLSLLLKVLEGESGDTLGRQLKLFHQRALPDLGSNIKCGNSLIGPDFYQQQKMADLTDEDHYRINVFDWDRAFPAIMKRGGFDAVIGNPPYIFTRNKGIEDAQKEYFYRHFQNQSSQLNTFGIFLEQSYRVMANSAFAGFITPNNWLTIDTFAPLRKFILNSARNIRLINILDRVFQVAHVDTAITLFIKGSPSNLTISEMEGQKIIFSKSVALDCIKDPSYIIQISLLREPNIAKILKSIERCSKPLNCFCKVSTGLKAYQTGKGKPLQTNMEKQGRIFHLRSPKGNNCERYLEGVDVCRYHLGWSGEYLNYGDWLAEPRKSVPFSGPRLLIRQIPAKPPYLVHAAYVDQKYYNDINSMIVFDPISEISLMYLLGIINSRLLSFWFQKTFDKLQRKIFPQFKVKELGIFPIKPINMAEALDLKRHDDMVGLVQRIIELKKKICNLKHDQEISLLQRQIDATDRQIDQLVYQLYGLTDEEIKIVEGQ